MHDRVRGPRSTRHRSLDPDPQVWCRTKEQAPATTEVYLQSNLDKRLELIGGDATDLARQKGTWTTTFGIFDSFGNEHTLQIGFQRSELPNQWLATVNIISEDETIIPDVSIATEGRNCLLYTSPSPRD